MNTVQLECFLAVAEYLNFSRAAESLKITQPAVSHQITSLEDELGARLFILEHPGNTICSTEIHKAFGVARPSLARTATENKE